jgi:hypothetical protein
LPVRAGGSVSSISSINQWKVHSIMHSNLEFELYRTLAADRIRNAPRAEFPERRQKPPPLRGRIAYIAGRLARRLDSESARRAIA